MAAKVKARYTGSGEYLNGVPASDLTEEQYDALSDEQRTEVNASPLYEAQAERKVERQPAKAEKAQAAVAAEEKKG